MARATLPKTTAPGPYANAGTLATWTAADVANKHQVRLTGREIVVARNTGASAATVTINSVALNGRTGDITAQSIAAGATRVYQRFPLEGWAQSDGYLYLEASSVDIQFLVIELPA